MPALRVLVVDDDFLARRYAQNVLTDAGYETVGAGSGLEALQVVKLQNPPFDLFLLDVMMPQMRGTELARYLRQTYPDTKILYVTGYAEQLFTDRPSLWEGEAFIEKPTSPEGLLQAVRLLLHGTIRNPPAAA